MNRLNRVVVGCIALLAAACGAVTPAKPIRVMPSAAVRPTRASAEPPRGHRSATVAQVELFQSWPSGFAPLTPVLPSTKSVWLEAIDGAEHHVELSFFYASIKEGTAIAEVVAALRRAVERGVDVKILLDQALQKSYAKSTDTLRATGATVRIVDFRPAMGGIQHAKYILIDGKSAAVGSANFDWRSLQHIHELGLLVRDPASLTALSEVFARDWAEAAGEKRVDEPRPPALVFPVPFRANGKDGAVTEGRLSPTMTPRGHLPRAKLDEIAQLLALILNAKRSVRVQLLNYHESFRNGAPYGAIHQRLVDAAGRGVHVQLLLSHWAIKENSRAELAALDAVDGIDVRFFRVPDASTGPIPFARVIHAKYMTVDGNIAWLGSSNWSGDYFFRSRNIGFILRGSAIPITLDRIFDGLWNAPQAKGFTAAFASAPPNY